MGKLSSLMKCSENVNVRNLYSRESEYIAKHDCNGNNDLALLPLLENEMPELTITLLQ